TTPTSAPRLLHQHHQLLPVYITDLALTDSSSLSLHAALPNCGLPPLKRGVPDPPSKGGYRTPPQKGGTGDQIGRSAPVPPRRDGGRADLRKEKGTPRGAGSLVSVVAGATAAVRSWRSGPCAARTTRPATTSRRSPARAPRAPNTRCAGTCGWGRSAQCVSPPRPCRSRA